MRAAVLLLCLLFAPVALADDPRPFDEWLAELIAEARERGWREQEAEQQNRGAHER